jgi:hypothetical protein
MPEMSEQQKEKAKRVVAQEKKQKKVLAKLGFVQMVFDFYTTPLE